jgi:hypothetical protein
LFHELSNSVSDELVARRGRVSSDTELDVLHVVLSSLGDTFREDVALDEVREETASKDLSIESDGVLAQSMRVSDIALESFFERVSSSASGDFFGDLFSTFDHSTSDSILALDDLLVHVLESDKIGVGLFHVCGV